ncbi:MAG TPA: hypothetical protein VK176_07195 [Phycisphaerales bacterium]|nr:hypothetical protein [Phycisphaerales bacterium]
MLTRTLSIALVCLGACVEVAYAQPRRIIMDVAMRADAVADAGECPILLPFPGTPYMGAYDVCSTFVQIPTQYIGLPWVCILYDRDSASYSTACSGSTASAVITGPVSAGITFDPDEIELYLSHKIDHAVATNTTTADPCIDPTAGMASTFLDVSGRNGPAARLIVPFTVEDGTVGDLIIQPNPILWPAVACYEADLSLVVTLTGPLGPMLTHTITLSEGQIDPGIAFHLVMPPGPYTLSAFYTFSSVLSGDSGCVDGCPEDQTVLEDINVEVYLATKTPDLIPQ